MKLIEVQAAKEFASTYLNDIFFKMAVNRVLDAAPAADAIPVNAEDRESAEKCLEVVGAYVNKTGAIVCATKGDDGKLNFMFMD